MRRPNARAASTHWSIVAPETGTSGQTSSAPMRGWAPRCFDMSISSLAATAPRNAASLTPSSAPTNVYTVRFVSAPGSTSSRRTPLTPEIARAIASITALSRPSEKFGTHSTSWDTAIPPFQGAPAVQVIDDQRGHEAHRDRNRLVRRVEARGVVPGGGPPVRHDAEP